MAEYKLYIFDDDDWVTGVRTLRCEDDECAVIAALGSGVDQRMELWSRDRPVETFGPAPSEDFQTEGPVGGEGRVRRRRAWGFIRTPARSLPPPSWGRRNS